MSSSPWSEFRGLGGRESAADGAGDVAVGAGDVADGADDEEASGRGAGGTFGASCGLGSPST